MYFLINELSLISQAKDSYEVDELMKDLFKIIEEITIIQNGDPILTHSSFASKNLSKNLTISQWIFQTIKSQKSNQQKIAQILLRLLSKGPFIDLQGVIDNCQCFYQKKDVSSSSLTGAVKLEGILISLQNAPNFTDGNIEVEFQENNNILESKIIKNLTKVDQAKKLCPRYKLHLKHDSLGYWKNATPMDLSDEKAQKVLNISIADINENSNKRYGFCKENDQFYVFHYDNTFDDEGYPTYHGYPIDEKEIPSVIKNKLITNKN